MNKLHIFKRKTLSLTVTYDALSAAAADDDEDFLFSVVLAIVTNYLLGSSPNYVIFLYKANT